MMNNIKKCFVLSLMASFMFSCTDIETIDLEKEAVKDLYENRDKDNGLRKMPRNNRIMRTLYA